MIEVRGNKGKYSLLPQQFESDYSIVVSTCLIFNDILMTYVDTSCLLKLYEYNIYIYICINGNSYIVVIKKLYSLQNK